MPDYARLAADLMALAEKAENMRPATTEILFARLAMKTAELAEAVRFHVDQQRENGERIPPAGLMR